MNDLIESPEFTDNAPEFSVSEISGAVKRLVEGEFSHVRIRGELGRVSKPASGHIYLDLKDAKAVLAGVIWKGVAYGLQVQPEEGMEVVATGRLTTFPGQSKYQLIIEQISPAGVGALMAMLEKRKKALAAEGLFNAELKKEIPYLPEIVGVITSPSGAVIRDILHRLSDRFPREVVIWPVAVQGQNSKTEVANAINGFNLFHKNGQIPRPDVIIVARGGGSIEDLWSFNEEEVVRAAVASDIPIISAIGHETDITLLDYVADKRAPTPTAAAEMAVPVRAELLAYLVSLEERRLRAGLQLLATRKQRLKDIGRALPRPDMILAERAQRLDLVSTRLPFALSQNIKTKRLQLQSEKTARFSGYLLFGLLNEKKQQLKNLSQSFVLARKSSFQRKKDQFYATQMMLRVSRLTEQLKMNSERLNARSRMLKTLGYEETLARGFAVIRDQDGVVLSNVNDAKTIAELEVQFRDGRMKVTPKP